MHHKRTAQTEAEPNPRRLIVQEWVELGRPAVNRKVLEAMLSRFDHGFADAAMSPASIARLLADQGAELSHPEIIEFDAQWRETQLRNQAGKFEDVVQFVSGKPLNLEQGELFIAKLETLRRQFEDQHDDSSLSAVRRLAVEARQRVQAMARNRGLDAGVRAEQSEIDDWLKVWLQTPALFGDWLELRRRSDDFRERFPGEDP